MRLYKTRQCVTLTSDLLNSKLVSEFELHVTCATRTSISVSCCCCCCCCYN